MREMNVRYNPAHYNPTTKILGFLGTERYTGVKKNIQQNIIGTQLNLLNKKDLHQSLGLTVLQEQKGSYIRYNRIKFNYLISKKISNDLFIASGINLGWFNYLIKTNPTGYQNSYSTPILDLGLKMYYKKSSIGFSINQGLNSVLNLPTTQHQLHRYITIDAMHKINIRDDIKLNLTANAFWYTQQINQYRIGTTVVYREQLLGGVNYISRLGMYVEIGYLYKINNHEGNLNFNYYVPVGTFNNFGSTKYIITFIYKKRHFKEKFKSRLPNN